MKLSLFFIFSLCFLMLGQTAAAEGNILQVDSESFCADVENLKVANAELLGSVIGLQWGTAIVKERSQTDLANIHAANELVISASRKILSAIEPFLELCATD